MYKRLFASLLAHADGAQERLYGDIKRELFAPLAGTVLEIGTGSGLNLRYLPPAVTHWIGVEPNPHFHAYVRAQDAAQRLDVTLYEAVAEALPVADHSVDAVISTLVLCSVDSVPRALDEVRRVLRPGGRFVFIEHVAADEGRWLHAAQQAIQPAWYYCADGCRLHRHTGEAIEDAGFAEVHLRRRMIGSGFNLVQPHIMGWART